MNGSFHKKAIAIILSALVAAGLTACGSSEPCACGATPTKAYLNEYTGEKEYYCKSCSSDCAFCSGEASRHYTGLGQVIFICDDCYDYIKGLNG